MFHLDIVVGLTFTLGIRKSQYRAKVFGGGRDFHRTNTAESNRPTSFPKIAVPHHQGTAPEYVKQDANVIINALSAAGSSILPKTDSFLYLRAIYPSKKSVTHAPIISPRAEAGESFTISTPIAGAVAKRIRVRQLGTVNRASLRGRTTEKLLDTSEPEKRPL